MLRWRRALVTVLLVHGASSLAIAGQTATNATDNATDDVETTVTTTTSTTLEVQVTSSDCAKHASDCGDCFANGCRFCQASPEPWSLYSTPSIIDYVCLPKYFQCLDLIQMRPGTGGVKAIAIDGCDEIPAAQAKTTHTTTTVTTRQKTGEMREFGGSEPSWWPSDWGVFHWIGVGAPVVVLILACGCLCFRWRRVSQRVHVAPQGAMETRAFQSKASAQWDFAQAGPINSSDLEAAKEALAASVREEFSGKLGPQPGVPPGRRCLSFWASNDLQASLLMDLEALLGRYPGLSISFDADWRGANDPALVALAKLLQRHRGRCKFRTDGLRPLRLSTLALPTTLSGIGEALASSHAEVDTLALEMPQESRRKGMEPTVLELAPLRLSSQEVKLNGQPIGDAGCAAACGFMKSWGSRLQIARLVECNLGDVGATAVARLVGNGKQPAFGLRELNLSANKIGDRGVADIADALPVLDSLERLLLERNRIGPVGAKALAQRLPRSNVRELVLGTHLGGNPIGPAGTKALAAALDDLLPRAAADRGTRLGALALEDCGVGEEGAQALADFLPKSNLQVLSVARGGLTDAESEVILKSLPNTMVSLDLAGNQLSDLTGSLVGEAFYSHPQLAVSLAQNFLTPTIKMLLQEEHGTRLRV